MSEHVEEAGGGPNQLQNQDLHPVATAERLHNLTAKVPGHLNHALDMLARETGWKKQKLIIDAVEYLIEHPEQFLARCRERWPTLKAARAEWEKMQHASNAM